MAVLSYSKDPGFLEDLDQIRNQWMSGPDPDHLQKVFPEWGIGFQMRVTKIIQDGATSKEAMVLLRPPPPVDLLPWLSVLFGLQVLALESWWKSAQALEKPDWMAGKSLVLVEPLDYVDKWQIVRAVCHVADEAESYPDALVHLHALARQAFRAQPLRTFIYGVLVVGSTFELWAFDRSGMYVSRAIDLRIEYLDAVSVIAGLGLMPLGDLGMDEMFDKDGKTGARHMAIPGEVLELRDEAVVTPHGIFGDRTLCCYARKQNEEQWGYAVKFKWRTSFKSKEEEIYRVTEDHGITNVASLVHHKRLGSTGELRHGLRHQAYRNLLGNGKELHQGRGFERYSEPSGFPFRDRTFMCFVVTPIGLPLSTFRSPVELLVVLQDAIQAHRDLLQTANILHRDISNSNILIDEKTRRGMLIDFDVSIDLSQRTPTAGNLAGTFEYAAAGLLRESPHTYRHDLESFFYVLIQALAWNEGRLPANSRFRRWTADEWNEATEARVEDMSKDNFPLLLGEWHMRFENLKKLAWTLWRLLFKDEDELFWGTDTSQEAMDAMYDGFLAAFDQALADCKST